MVALTRGLGDGQRSSTQANMTLSNSEIDDLAYRPASNVVVDSDGPLRGNTIFCDVPYTFQRKPHEDPIANLWGMWFDLIPVDGHLGLPMRAIGRFRETSSVRWTSFGSPILIHGPDIRERYAGFLERLANGTATYALWEAFNVAHYYSDDRLEQVRIECVRLFLARGGIRDLTIAERVKLASMIERLHQ